MSRWNVGLWGTQGSQDARCNYQLSIHQSAADALTFGPPFSDTVEGNAPNYYSFVLAGTFSSSLTLFLGTANDMVSPLFWCRRAASVDGDIDTRGVH
jgi:hypothetical protein